MFSDEHSTPCSPPPAATGPRRRHLFSVPSPPLDQAIAIAERIEQLESRTAASDAMVAELSVRLDELAHQHGGQQADWGCGGDPAPTRRAWRTRLIAALSSGFAGASAGIGVAAAAAYLAGAFFCRALGLA